MTFLIDTNVVADLIASNALFVINHSGGKDSQAMMIEMLKVIPKAQMIVVHASLGEAEWKGAKELAEKQAADAGIPFFVAEDETGFLGRVEARWMQKGQTAPSFPSKQARYCTSSLKREPIAKVARRYWAANGKPGAVVMCEGLRAQESTDRAKTAVFERGKRDNTQKRAMWMWRPIHAMKIDQVWATIAQAGQQPHFAYAQGNDRLSCLFCFMGSAKDLANGAKHNPKTFRDFIAMEKKTGFTLHVSQRSLFDIVSSVLGETDALALAA
jgi:3'-phosphoadenosine 5'-phosphosulfate sulfotransferase (PAPS reductase)/FAD synthetase